MGEVDDINISPEGPDAETAVASGTAFDLSSPTKSLSRSPRTPEFMTPLASPMKKAIASMQSYLEEAAQFTKLDPQDAWLPITESRNGNAYYAAFHMLSSGIGVQALVLPLAFTALGW